MIDKISHGDVSKIGRPDSVDLASSIPLETPFAYYIDITSKCNLRCRFCFQHTFPDYPQEHMTEETFQKLVNDSLKFKPPHGHSKPIKVIHLHTFGEPLLNKRLPDYIRLCREKLTDRVNIFTNGTLFPLTGAVDVIDAGLTKIKVSIEGVSSEQYQRVTSRKVDFEKLCERLANLYEHKKDCVIEIKIVDTGLTKEERSKFFDTFKDISDFCHIENVLDIYNGDPNEFNFKSGQHNYENDYNWEICPAPFYTLVMRYNGDVVACVKDCASEIVLGNINQQDLTEIWNGTKYREFLINRLKSDYSQIPLCENCSDKKVYQDNLDSFKDELLIRMESC